MRREIVEIEREGATHRVEVAWDEASLAWELCSRAKKSPKKVASMKHGTITATPDRLDFDREAVAKRFWEPGKRRLLAMGRIVLQDAPKAKRKSEPKAEPVETPADIVIPPSSKVDSHPGRPVPVDDPEADALIDAATSADKAAEGSFLESLVKLQAVVEHYAQRPEDLQWKLEKTVSRREAARDRNHPLQSKVVAIVLAHRIKQTRSETANVLVQYARTRKEGEDIVQWLDGETPFAKARRLRREEKGKPPPKPAISREKLVEALRQHMLVVRVTNHKGEHVCDYDLETVEIDDKPGQPVAIVFRSIEIDNDA